MPDVVTSDGKIRMNRGRCDRLRERDAVLGMSVRPVQAPLMGVLLDGCGRTAARRGVETTNVRRSRTIRGWHWRRPPSSLRRSCARQKRGTMPRVRPHRSRRHQRLGSPVLVHCRGGRVTTSVMLSLGGNDQAVEDVELAERVEEHIVVREVARVGHGAIGDVRTHRRLLAHQYPRGRNHHPTLALWEEVRSARFDLPVSDPRRIDVHVTAGW